MKRKISKELFIVILGMSCLAIAIGGALIGRHVNEAQVKKYKAENIYIVNDSMVHANISGSSCVMFTLHSECGRLDIEMNNMKNFECCKGEKLMFTSEDWHHREFTFEELFPGKEINSLEISYSHEH